MISIIVPVYNCEKYLPACIESILNQSYRDFEAILIDDCSTDQSYEICQQYAQKDQRIIVLKNEKNSGTSKGRNVGIKVARGELLAFVDDDDILEEDYLKIMYEKQKKYDADIVQCRFEKFYDENKIEPQTSVKKDVMHTNLGAINSLYMEHGVQTCVVFNKLYKKSIFDTLRFDDGKVHEDTFIIHKLLYASSKIVFIDNILYHYRKSGESITTSKFSKSRLDELEGIEQRVLFLKKVNRNLYIKSMIQLGELQVNLYYNMKKIFPEDKEQIYLIRANFNRYFNILKRYRAYMTRKARRDIFYFKYCPRIFYWLEYKNRLDFFTQS